MFVRVKYNFHNSLDINKIYGSKSVAKRRFASLLGDSRFSLFSPGKNLARRAVFIGAGLKTVTFGPKFLHSFAHEFTKDICAIFDDP